METKIERTHWGNGKLRSEQPRVGGERHGLQRWWWESGQLRSERPYVGGVPHGVRKWWYPSGQQESEIPYVGGVWHGMVKYWHQNGDIGWFWLWNQGEQVATFYPRNETQRWKLK
jgi:antitoxin component YwqK of YwqJK toxin-antitoxin module